MTGASNVFGYRTPDLSEFSCSDSALELIRISLVETLRCLGVRLTRRRNLAEQIIDKLRKGRSLAELEADMHELCAPDISPVKLRRALDERASLIAKQISSHLIGPRLLDLGCGDGMVLAKLKHGRYEILLADQLNYVDPRVHFPFRRLREGGLLEIREDFDTVLLLTVLHHSTEPARIVSDLRSLNPQRVVVIESVLDPPSPHNETAMLLAAQDFKSRLAFAVFADWFYNRVLHKDIPVPYNFGCINDWNKLFAEYGFRGKIATNLGLDQSLVPEVHMLLIYERSGG